MKHAFLVIAHNEYELLKSLISLLDHQDNDIYIHIDKKVSGWNFAELMKCAKKSHIEIYQEISVSWGDTTQAQCELLLLKKSQVRNYDYYHFLSGVDLPIKSMQQIHNFFEMYSGQEFIHFDKKIVDENSYDRVFYYHFFSKYLKRFHSKVITKLLFVLDGMSVSVQKKLGMKRNIPYPFIQKGCNWCSITNNLAKYVLEEEEKIIQLLDRSVCGDEIFIQTVCVNSSFSERLYNKNFDNSYDACKRLIVWDEKNKKSPRVFSDSDWNLLENSTCLFARKFSMNLEKEFTSSWIRHIQELNK